MVAVVSMSKREFDRLEVLTGVQAGRLRVAEACALSGLSRRQVFRLQGFREDGLQACCSSAPVRVMVELPAPTAAPEPSGAMIPAPHRRVEAAAGDGRIEIALADGTCIRVGGDVGLAALRRVMAVLRA